MAILLGQYCGRSQYEVLTFDTRIPNTRDAGGVEKIASVVVPKFP